MWVTQPPSGVDPSYKRVSIVGQDGTTYYWSPLTTNSGLHLVDGPSGAGNSPSSALRVDNVEMDEGQAAYAQRHVRYMLDPLSGYIGAPPNAGDAVYIGAWRTFTWSPLIVTLTAIPNGFGNTSDSHRFQFAVGPRAPAYDSGWMKVGPMLEGNGDNPVTMVLEIRYATAGVNFTIEMRFRFLTFGSPARNFGYTVHLDSMGSMNWKRQQISGIQGYPAQGTVQPAATNPAATVNAPNQVGAAKVSTDAGNIATIGSDAGIYVPGGPTTTPGDTGWHYANDPGEPILSATIYDSAKAGGAGGVTFGPHFRFRREAAGCVFIESLLLNVPVSGTSPIISFPAGFRQAYTLYFITGCRRHRSGCGCSSRQVSSSTWPGRATTTPPSAASPGWPRTCRPGTRPGSSSLRPTAGATAAASARPRCATASTTPGTCMSRE